MMMTRAIVFPFLLVLYGTAAYEQWSSAGIGRPEVNRRAIAGIWKLTPKAAVQLPMKEFTVYPKKTKKPEEEDVPELLLMLKEDGSFHQYSSSSSEQDNENVDIDSSWTEFQTSRQKRKGDKLRDFIKGTWDFLDGNLILAADRPEERSYSTIADGHQHQEEEQNRNQKTNPDLKTKDEKKGAADTLLKGRVVASYQTRLEENPALVSESSSSNNATATRSTALDTHLSVPKGSINIGKFFYPKNHPSFFEQPMFKPVKEGTVTLRQILGSLNTEHNNNDHVVEKYQRSDFYNKTFLLTSHPIGQRQPKGNTRWSIKYNKFVEDPPNPKAAQAAEEANKRAANIRVVQVAFHANNTFSTVAGLGGAAILRGKFDIVGSEKDQLWMQVIRFGFGRSVSGSVYSEGRMLSHEDAKAYWGTIKTSDSDNDDKKEEKDSDSENLPLDDLTRADAVDVGDDKGQQDPQRLEVHGSVLDGWGLEPLPVARFILKEVLNEIDVEEEDDEDEEEEDDEALSEEIAKLDAGLMDNDGIDWSEEDESSFQ